MWKDDLQIAVSNAVQEGATQEDFHEYYRDCVEAYNWMEDLPGEEE